MKHLICIVFLSLVNCIYGLSIEENITNNIVNSNLIKPMCSEDTRCRSVLTKQFYTQNNSTPIWIENNQVKSSAINLINTVKNSYQEGINPNNYTIDNVEELLIEYAENKDTNNTNIILADLDVSLTDLFFQYATTLVYGQVNNKDVYPTWKITKRSVDLLAKLNQVSQENNLAEVLNSLIPQYPEYNKLKDKLAFYQQIVAKGGWPTVPSGPKLQIGDKSKRVQKLQERLLITGELKSIKHKGLFDESVKKAVMLFQSSHGIEPDGVVGPSTIAELNVSAKKRTQQIELNMDRIRWLPTDLGKRYILVNIPDYSLEVFDNNRVVLSMPVIVGRDENLQSCVLSSAIKYVDFNPYWYVPNSIATKEILPKLKKDPNYLAKNNIEVFTSYGSPPIDPEEINWEEVSNHNFPYKFRQLPGVDNPLGQVKFIFPNSCGIYLHDTSNPELFKRSKRAFSHGCIRIGKPIDLAAYLLSDKPNWTREQILKTIATGKNRAIYLTEPINIYIVYQTVWVNEEGILQFRHDLYNIDSIPYTVANKSDNG